MTPGLFYRDPEGNEHDIGDDACMACWPRYPRACSCPNPHRVHVWYVDESWDGVILGYYCEECGSISGFDVED